MTRWNLENINHYTVKSFWYRVLGKNYFRVQEGILSEACKMHVVNEVVRIHFF